VTFLKTSEAFIERQGFCYPLWLFL